VSVFEEFGLSDGTTVYTEYCGVFGEGRYRTDVISNSAEAEVFARHEAPIPPRLSSAAWNGHHVLVAKTSPFQTEYSVCMLDDLNTRLEDLAWLGVPLVQRRSATPRTAYDGVKILSESKTGSIHTVRFQPNRNPPGSATATFVIDSAKGWSLTSYEIESRREGITWTLKGEIVPQRYGDTWYPGWFRYEQWKDGTLDWYREYTITEAEFEASVPESEFTFEGIGAPAGAMILSYSRELSHGRWTGSKVEPLRATQKQRK